MKISVAAEYRRLLDQCTEKDREKCRKQSGPYLAEACRTCRKNPDNREPPHPWFEHVYWLYRLKVAGYPFGKNDLTLEEWEAMGELAEAIEASRPRLF